MKELRYKDIREFDTNLIEYKGISTYPNGFEINYNGSCQKCDFTFGYKNEVKIPLDLEEDDKYFVIDCDKDDFIKLCIFLLQESDIDEKLILQLNRSTNEN